MVGLGRGVDGEDSRASLAAAIFCASFDNGLANSSTPEGVDERDGVEVEAWVEGEDRAAASFRF